MADSLKTPVELCGHCGRDGEMVGHIHSYLDKRFLAFVSVVVDQQHNHNNVILTFGLQTNRQPSWCHRLVLEMTTQFLDAKHLYW